MLLFAACASTRSHGLGPPRALPIPQGTLQFVIAKPILAALTLVLFITGDYHVSNWAWNDGCAQEHDAQ